MKSSSTPDKKDNAGSKGTAGAFPYPGDAVDTQGAASSDASSSSTSSSSSSSSPTNDPDMPPDLTDVGSEGATTRRRLPKVTKLQSDEDRADEDLNVASFYQDKGDLNAAYLRLRDAVKVQPKMADAHLALAQLAEKMKKKEEAASEFKAYLSLDPDGEKNKDVARALAALK